GLITAFMTAFYMWRLMYLTFYGASRVEPQVASHIHESPSTMTIPLSVLAAGSVLAGWVGVPKLWVAFPDTMRAFEHWLAPVFASAEAHGAGEAHHDTTVEWLLMGLSIVVALSGIAL